MIFKISGDTINSFTASFSIDNGAVTSETFSGISFYFSNAFIFSGAASFPSTGLHSIKVWTSMPNGVADLDPANDTVKKDVIVLQTAPEKMVLLEEITGEWCGYCPDGDLKVQSDLDSFPNHLVAIQFHNADQFSIPYDITLESFFPPGGYPQAMIDQYKFSSLNSMFLDRPWFDYTYERLQMVSPCDVVFSNQQYNSVTKDFSITATTNFYGEDTGSLQMDLVVTEDSVPAEAQNNYYNDGSVDPYSPLVGIGNPINVWFHEHVARAVMSAPSSTIPASIPSSGGSYSYTFTGTLGSTWNANHIHYIGMVYKKSSDPENSQVLNSNSFGVATSSPEITKNNSTLGVFPNPMSDFSIINFSLENSSQVKLRVYDAFGNLRRTLLQTPLNSGKHQLMWNGKDDSGIELPASIYFLIFSGDNFSSTIKIIKR